MVLRQRTSIRDQELGLVSESQRVTSQLPIHFACVACFPPDHYGGTFGTETEAEFLFSDDAFQIDTIRFEMAHAC